MIKSPPLGQRIELEVISTTFLRTISNIKFFLKNLLFPPTVIEWDNLDQGIRSSESFTLYKKTILQFIQPSLNRTFTCHNPIRIKLIIRLRLGFSQLQDHRIKHNFIDCLNSICCWAMPLKQLFITSFIVQFFKRKDRLFSTTFEASMKTF